MKIFGKVQDTNNESLPYANILLVGGSQANKGAVADVDGNFILESPIIDANSIFEISYIGYKPQKFKASELQGKTIKLEQDTFALEEVVVTKIGTKPTNEGNESKKITRAKFTQHLQKHRFAYAGLGALAGVLLIVKSLKQ